MTLTGHGQLASVGLEELNSARHSLGTLIAVKCKESKNRLADGQAFLMNVDDTSVLSSRSMDSKEVIIMCDKYTALPPCVGELLEIGSAYSPATLDVVTSMPRYSRPFTTALETLSSR